MRRRNFYAINSFFGSLYRPKKKWTGCNDLILISFSFFHFIFNFRIWPNCFFFLSSVCAKEDNKMRYRTKLMFICLFTFFYFSCSFHSSYIPSFSSHFACFWTILTNYSQKRHFLCFLLIVRLSPKGFFFSRFFGISGNEYIALWSYGN
jgi:hypothetical protein